jgi:hypothetical protein
MCDGYHTASGASCSQGEEGAARARYRKNPLTIVGQWAAPFLLLGVYHKMVKQHGSDAESQQKALKAKAATVAA